MFIKNKHYISFTPLLEIRCRLFDDDDNDGGNNNNNSIQFFIIYVLSQQL
jgi:hypothetical protein